MFFGKYWPVSNEIRKIFLSGPYENCFPGLRKRSGRIKLQVYEDISDFICKLYEKGSGTAEDACLPLL